MEFDTVPLRPLSFRSAASSVPAPDPMISAVAAAPSLSSSSPPTASPTPNLGLNTAFFLFGLLNNSLYVVILTAALELLPQGVPTGLVSLVNILPALIAKAIWPYVLKGNIRYTQRVWSCTALSFVGMMMIALFPSLTMRLLGISLASFSSGLGELTFLQLSTRYALYSGDAVGWFASGTGAAGLVGAVAWWIVRPLGVKLGLAILSLLPAFMAGAYLLILPSVQQLVETSHNVDTSGYQPLALDEQDEPQDRHDPMDDLQNDRVDTDRNVSYPVPNSTSTTSSIVNNMVELSSTSKVGLSFEEKLALLKPMLWPYILPLITVYFAEYTINQGVAPTLVYPLPTHSQHPLLSLIIKNLSDYYPLYQLIYQTFVFISRSSISILKLPAIPREWLWLPAILQTSLLALLTTESLYTWFKPSIASPLVIVLICIEGLAGGSAYVSVFYSIGVDRSPSSSTIIHLQSPSELQQDQDELIKQDQIVKSAQQQEFRIGCVGLGDSLGILIASIVSIPLQLSLCNYQVGSGRDLCKQV